MRVMVMDGQGGGIGRALVEWMRRERPEWEIVAVGTNAMATAAMLKAGATAGATGENAVMVCAREADVIAGPIGIVFADAMLGEVTAPMAAAIGRSRAEKVLIPVTRCHSHIAGLVEKPVLQYVQDAVRLILSMEAQA